MEEPLIDRQRKKEELKKAKKLADQQKAAKEETKIALPMFSNQKDDSKQDRTLSKLRVATAAATPVDKSDQSSLSTPSSTQVASSDQ